MRTINPRNEKGKIILITRFGADKVREKLSVVIQKVRAAGMNVLWQCDPMHGNTRKTEAGMKTRSFDRIRRELMTTLQVHREQGSFLGGVHFEMTGEDVIECTGGPQEIQDKDLGTSNLPSRRYKTGCDPRLNYAQAMSMAFQLAEYLSNKDDSKERVECSTPKLGPSDPIH